MIKEIEIKVLPFEINQEDLIKERAIRKAKAKPKNVREVKLLRRSIDARGKTPFYLVRLAVYIEEYPPSPPPLLSEIQSVGGRQEAIIVGAGPAGYFAALELLANGIKPVIFDRGKDVRARRRDLRAIQQEGIVNPDSNYCFGEGGAGTYSDGKLYTRSHKRGDIKKALQLLVEHGAKEDILIDAHPHIGSNKLPKIVAAIRNTILEAGGAIHFDSKVVDLILQERKIAGVRLANGTEYLSDVVILATGHSARDIYELLQEKGISLELKPFALGVRIEHAQQLIDKIQYGQERRALELPASSYRLACQVSNRGVFSFCMCPGGLVVPAATAPGEIVVNGMSMSRRDSAFANAGTVVSISQEDLVDYQNYGPLAALKFQEAVEKQMFNFGDGSQRAPAQRLTDFVAGKLSVDLNDSSYIPGLVSAPLHTLLPDFVYASLRAGIQQFGRKMPGYYTELANVIGTESRSSSPIRIPRNKETFMHEEVEGLFPCGEGAGYAGGIISAAMDGQNVARAVAAFLTAHV